jgi:hypothetical protein
MVLTAIETMLKRDQQRAVLLSELSDEPSGITGARALPANLNEHQRLGWIVKRTVHVVPGERGGFARGLRMKTRAATKWDDRHSLLLERCVSPTGVVQLLRKPLCHW